MPLSAATGPQLLAPRRQRLDAGLFTIGAAATAAATSPPPPTASGAATPATTQPVATRPSALRHHGPPAGEQPRGEPRCPLGRAQSWRCRPRRHCHQHAECGGGQRSRATRARSSRPSGRSSAQPSTVQSHPWRPVGDAGPTQAVLRGEAPSSSRPQFGHRGCGRPRPVTGHRGAVAAHLTLPDAPPARCTMIGRASAIAQRTASTGSGGRGEPVLLELTDDRAGRARMDCAGTSSCSR
jgi:hypothetical protein